MQSFLQYRKVGQAVERQLGRERDLEIQSTPANHGSHSPPPALPPTEEAQPSGGEDVGNLSSLQDTDSDIENVVPTRTRNSERTALGHALTGIHARDRTTHEGKGSKVFVVDWEGDHDLLNPRNWSTGKRLGTTWVVSSISFVVGLASSIDTAVSPQASAEYGVSEVAESLAIGIYLMGFAAGAVFAGPFSETFGRNTVYIATMFLFSVFVMASALAPNFGAQLAFRFLAGFFGSTPLTCAGGSISDMWDPLEKSYAFSIFAIPGFGGPVLGPVIGSYIGIGNIGSWRWSEWITLILAGLVTGLILLFQSETYPPLLLKWKAQHLRRITGDDRFRAPMEITKTTLWSLLKIAMKRPFLLMTEPIVLLMAFYLTILYIVLFTFLSGYTFIFTNTYGISQGLTNVIFVGMFVGILLAIPLVPFALHKTKQDLRKSASKGNAQFNPEVRLWFAMLGAPAIPISLFWMGWTARPSISIWSPILASVLFGYGLICIFMSAYMYIIDSYEMYAASALTFVTFIRYIVAGGMTVVGIPFYKNVGVHWTLTTLGCISLLMTPIPYLLFVYGPLVRGKSKYAVSRS